MHKILWFLCGMAEGAAIGAVLALRLPLGPAVWLLILPLALAVVVRLHQRWIEAREARRLMVQVYVPPEQRMNPYQVTRTYEPGPGWLGAHERRPGW